jgi:hypothetical protein
MFQNHSLFFSKSFSEVTSKVHEVKCVHFEVKQLIVELDTPYTVSKQSNIICACTVYTVLCTLDIVYCTLYYTYSNK